MTKEYTATTTARADMDRERFMKRLELLMALVGAAAMVYGGGRVELYRHFARVLDDKLPDSDGSFSKAVDRWVNDFKNSGRDAVLELEQGKR
jgi:hypothetical protein